MRRRTLLFSALPLLVAPAAAALPLSFQGSLAADDDVSLVSFDVEAPANVTIRSFGYAGGTQQDGTPVPAGGFDPIVSLFDGAGALVGENDDGRSEAGSCLVRSDPGGGGPFDACLVVTLEAGSYTVAVSQFDNFPVGDTLAEGFDFSGAPNFTADDGCPNGQFCDVRGNDRTNAWAFDVVATSAVPEPATLALWLMGASGLAWLGRRRQPRLPAAK
jgi:hypothetical protein